MKEHTFAMDLTPNGSQCCVLLDGDDISGLLRGVTIHAEALRATTVELHPRAGCRAQLMIRLPEARIAIAEEPTP